MILSLTDSADNFMFRLDGFGRCELASSTALMALDDSKFSRSQPCIEIGADLGMCDLAHPTTEPVADQSTFIHNRLALAVLVTGKGERFSNAVKRVDGLVLLLKPFSGRSNNGLGLVSKVRSQLPVSGHHLFR